MLRARKHTSNGKGSVSRQLIAINAPSVMRRKELAKLECGEKVVNLAR